jgi:pseudouridylate synthase
MGSVEERSGGRQGYPAAGEAGMSGADAWCEFAPEVRGAVAEGRPVVALESTVLAHGLPRPRNLEVGRSLEGAVRGAGATPATVAIVDGVPRVGLTERELERIAMEPGVAKLSTREISLAMARGTTGATTVAATAWLAARAGIRVFATGGIGGVHRGSPADVSPDLVELQRTPIIVVCAGAKSILDLPATREALETLGVLVLGWRTDRFPAFYTRSSDLTVDATVTDAAEVALIWREHRRSAAAGSILLCVPVPPEHEVPPELVSAAIDDALARAESEGVRGKEITPYLLRTLAESTGGATLEANVALLHGNARVAAEVARAIAG